MKILIIAPHMDDETLGCGGTISRHIEKKDQVFVSFIANRIYNHCFDIKKDEIEKKQALKAKKILGYKEAFFFGLNDERLGESIQKIIMPLEKCVSEIKPDIVYCPFWGDNNQDHRAVFDAARVVLRPAETSFIKNIFIYETPSSTEQSPPAPENAFLPNYYADITKHIAKKTAALKSYETEGRKYPHPRSLKAISILAQKRGIEIGFPYAEAFIMIRGKM